MPEDANRNRRSWIRFSLRTMLIVVALLAIFIAYHANWIRQRHAVLIEFFGKVNDPNPHDLPDDLFDLPDSAPFIERIERKLNLPDGPGLLWIFGERAHTNIAIHFGRRFGRVRALTPDEQSKVDLIRRLFPEAQVKADAVE